MNTCCEVVEMKKRLDDAVQFHAMMESIYYDISYALENGNEKLIIRCEDTNDCEDLRELFTEDIIDELTIWGYECTVSRKKFKISW